jgi:lantibiotic modifying enzyme
MNEQEIRDLAKALAEELHNLHNADTAPKWVNGSLFFIPANSQMKDHEMPINVFMNKIIMMRDNLRILEQQINSNPNLNHGEKIKLQSYITKCYGSFTSFNFLFQNDQDKFSSK